MKVTFKLTSAQVSTFKKALVVYLENIETFKNSSYPFNNDQKFHLKGSSLTYTGQRCPFVQDGGLELVRSLGELEVVQYETSDERLNWDETMASAIESRPDQFSVGEKLKFSSNFHQYFPKILQAADDKALYRASLSYGISMSEAIQIQKYSENH